MADSMTAKKFQPYLERDGLMCYATGKHVYTGQLVPQHRQGGMGGRADKHRPSNVITFDSIMNGQLEALPTLAQHAREKGWKLESWQEPSETPVFHYSFGWVMLDDEFGIRPATTAELREFRASLKGARDGH